VTENWRWRLTAPGDPATAEQIRTLAGMTPGSRVLIVADSPRAFCELVTACWDWRLTVTPAATAADATAIAPHLDPHLILFAGQTARLMTAPGQTGHQTARLPPGDGSLAFIVYTSGSTGNPKGVMLSRRAVEANALATSAEHRFAPGAAHATCLPLHHCNALIGSLLGCYLTGTSLTVHAPYSPCKYSEAITASAATTASIVPALLARWLDAATPWPPSLRYLITAAAPLTSALAREFAAAHGPRLRQGYGMTEACNYSFLMPLLDDSRFTAECARRRPPVGSPLPGTKWRLIGDEVQLSGEYLMDGYWRNPDATAAALTDDRWLRTGDLGDARADGDGGYWLVLTGRAGDTINRGGEMIHPAAVEEAWEAAGLPRPFAAAKVTSDGLGEDVGLWAEFPHPPAVHALTTTARYPPATAQFGPYPVTAAGKPRRALLTASAARPKTASPERYAALTGHAALCAYRILGGPDARTPPARYIARESARLLNSGAVPARLPGAGVAGEALSLLAANWPGIADGTLSGAGMIRRVPGLWGRLMGEWPMGDYAGMMAAHLTARPDLSGRVLELGAGTGATSRLLDGHAGDGYVRSDRHLTLLGAGPGTTMAVDFDEAVPAPLDHPAAGWDVIFATNALHCAADRPAAIGRIAAALAPGGRLILAEGSPEPSPGVPWALNLLFGLLPGWYDRGGFRPRWEWLTLMTSAGLTAPGYAQLRAGHNDLGGLIWAERPPG
jgi:long-chain acyl-CoA synthetase